MAPRRERAIVIAAGVALAASLLAIGVFSILARSAIESAAVPAVPRLSPSAAHQTLVDAKYAFRSGQYAQAIAQFQRLAAQDDPEALYWLGFAFANGFGVQRDDTVAAVWFQRGAELGYAPAEREYGLACAQGNGAPRSDKVAADWYRKAATQGDARAQFYLAMSYDRGAGVPQYPVLAYVWLMVAKKNADPADAITDFIEGNRPGFLAKLDADQRTAAQLLLVAWCVQ